VRHPLAWLVAIGRREHERDTRLTTRWNEVTTAAAAED
jgi:hypothetical protein